MPEKPVVEVPTAGPRLLRKSDILGASDLARDTVPTPEWGEGSAVRVQALDVNRRLAWLEYISVREQNASTGRRESVVDPFKSSDAALVALGVIDEQGEPMFTLADVEELGRKHPRVIGRIAVVVSRLSRLEDTEVSTPLDGTGASPTDSPVT